MKEWIKKYILKRKKGFKQFECEDCIYEDTIYCPCNLECLI